MLFHSQSRDQIGNSVCLELINEGDRGDIKINFLDIAKALLKVCRDARLDVLTTISRSGYKSLIVLSSERDLISCRDVLKAFIVAYGSNHIKVNEVRCDSAVTKVIPF